MSDKIEWESLARFLSDECTPEEVQQIERWIAASPKNRRLIDSLRIIWETQEVLPSDSNLQALWLDTARKAGITGTPEGDAVKRPLPRFPRNIRSLRLLPYAALLLLAFSFFLWKYTGLFRAGPSPVIQMISVPNGQTKALTLADGTRVTLDSGTTFRYPDPFPKSAREVHLEGEGFFEVARNSGKSFIVHAHNALIQVVGTEFNISAWGREKDVTVSVMEGKVALRREGASQEESVILTKGWMSTLPVQGNPTIPVEVDLKKRPSWMRREVDLVDVTLEDILLHLQRWYDFRFIIEKESSAQERLTLHIQNQSIQDILTLLGTLTNMDVEFKNGIVRLKPKSIGE